MNTCCAKRNRDESFMSLKSAIDIHEKVNGPECQALFIFDNSSAHATLPPDALCAFDMNKGNTIKSGSFQTWAPPENDNFKW